jgi:hypothetical protein
MGSFPFVKSRKNYIAHNSARYQENGRVTWQIG